MGIRTALTDAFNLDYPIVLAPMNQIADGRLAAAVSDAGGLGIVGGGYGDPAWLRAELAAVRAATGRPFAVGLNVWHAGREALDAALDARPAAVLLSFGDLGAYAPVVKAAGCALLCQVQEVEAARAAVAAGADFVVAQGTEAGGHGATRASLPLVPAVVDAVAPVPVIAAGGIADGRGLAAVLMLGAHGAMLGTRFFATAEACAPDAAKARLVAARAGDTARSTVFDIVRGYAWPAAFTGRVLRNAFFERWHGREAELEARLGVEMAAYRRAVDEADFDTAMVAAGEGVDLIDAVAPAAAVVRRIGADAEDRLRGGVALLA